MSSERRLPPFAEDALEVLREAGEDGVSGHIYHGFIRTGEQFPQSSIFDGFLAFTRQLI